MDEVLQELNIEDGVLTLDDLKIRNLISYTIAKNSAESPTELSITLLIKDIKISDGV